MPNNSVFVERALEQIDVKLDEIADFIFSKSQESIVIQGISDEGTLLQSGNIERDFLHKRIVYHAVHAAPIEFGTFPHMPPVKPLQAWAKRKLGIREPENKSVGWAIAKTIEKEGMSPKPFLRPALEQAVNKYG